MLKAVEELSVASSDDPEELEAWEARGKRVAEMIQKQIAMANSAPTERVAGLVDVIDETEELCYCWRLIIVSKFVCDSQAYKSPVVVKGPFFPRVVNPRYRIRGTNVWRKSWSSKAK
jgi:hypothetical protein